MTHIGAALTNQISLTQTRFPIGLHDRLITATVTFSQAPRRRLWIYAGSGPTDLNHLIETQAPDSRIQNKPALRTPGCTPPRGPEDLLFLYAYRGTPPDDLQLNMYVPTKPTKIFLFKLCGPKPCCLAAQYICSGQEPPRSRDNFPKL